MGCPKPLNYLTSLLEGGLPKNKNYSLIQPTGEIFFKIVNLGDQSLPLGELLQQNRQAIGVRERGGFVNASSVVNETEQLRQLHQLLIEPVADYLPDDPDQLITFIPQGELFLVPFPALINAEGDYLIENHTISTSPSIQALDLTQRQKLTLQATSNASENSVLVVGNPNMPEVWNPETSQLEQLTDLPGAKQEAGAVANFLGATALLQGQATEYTIKQRIGEASIVHFATHGLLEYGNSKDSGIRDFPGAIALTPGDGEDGLLTSLEIFDELELTADLVVLSACDTGLGAITGDGVIGLSRSLMAAGTPSVVVSLWSVPDAPTAELMTEFYRQLDQGRDKAQALRYAMLATLETNPRPKDWAAFTLIGQAE